ncbi:hypothetical protein [Pseudomonas sp. 2FG]|uniref:hypothetical protein n=1 Tax=Pseudomonas sp. 2FG TaxID=2502191 RepID=UPI001484E51D|nr:hypothetical protein [Pseudomonas sp. 2FG]
MTSFRPEHGALTAQAVIAAQAIEKVAAGGTHQDIGTFIGIYSGHKHAPSALAAL